MIQISPKGMRVIFSLDESNREKLQSLFLCLQDCDSHCRKIGNIHIKRTGLKPGERSKDLAELRLVLKPLMEKYFKQEYGFKSARQYSTMIVDNALKSFETRSARFGKRIFNLFQPSTAKPSICMDANKVVYVDTGDVELIDTTNELTLIKGKALQFDGVGNEKIIINFLIPTRQKHLFIDSPFFREDNRRIGGWLTATNKSLHSFYYTVLVNNIWDTAYEPEGTIGFDFNMRDDVFVQFDNGDVLLKSEDIKKELADLKEINSKINAHSGSRKRPLHLKRIQIHRNVMNKMVTLVDTLLDKCESEKLLLAIDDIANPNYVSYGQYEFKVVLLKEALKRKIPHVLVPTPFTSAYCYHCADLENGIYNNIFRDKVNSPHTVYCSTCGKDYNSDIMAAMNIALEGEYLFYNFYAPSEKPSHKQTELIERMQGLTHIYYSPLLWSNIDRISRYDNRKTIVWTPKQQGLGF